MRELPFEARAATAGEKARPDHFPRCTQWWIQFAVLIPGHKTRSIYFHLSQSNQQARGTFFICRGQASWKTRERRMPAYISELSYAGDEDDDFVEIAVPSGTDVSGYSLLLYSNDGGVEETASLGSPVSSSGGMDVYLVDDSSGFTGLEPDRAVALVDDNGTVQQFLSFGNTVVAKEGPADGQSSVDIGQSKTSLETTNGGNSYEPQPVPNPGTIPCYALGTLIDTPDGPRAVEDLQVGDLVTTLGLGPQVIRWIRRTNQSLNSAEDDARPVQIKAGALGWNLPTQTLIVSPHHRILVGDAGQLQHIFSRAVFAPAKSLTALPGIRHMEGETDITWIHFACDRHEVVTANGCLSETLLLGPMVVNGLNSVECRALADIFGPAPTPDAALNGPCAKKCLKVGVVKRKIAEHLRAKDAILAKEIQKWDRDLAMERYETARMSKAREPVLSNETTADLTSA